MTLLQGWNQDSKLDRESCRNWEIKEEVKIHQVNKKRKKKIHQNQKMKDKYGYLCQTKKGLDQKKNYLGASSINKEDQAKKK